MLSIGAESFVFQFAIQKYKTEIYRTVMLPVVLYGCEAWSVTLRDEHRGRVFESRALRKTFWLKKDEERGVKKTK